jgi:hypothetical protein
VKRGVNKKTGKKRRPGGRSRVFEVLGAFLGGMPGFIRQRLRVFFIFCYAVELCVIIIFKVCGKGTAERNEN